MAEKESQLERALKKQKDFKEQLGLAQEEAEAEIQAIQDEADKKIAAIREKLRTLGLLEPEPELKAAPKKEIKRPRDPNKLCEICGVKGHDKRAHRNHPEKFTHDELVQRGLPTGK